MVEVVSTNDPGVLALIDSLLTDADIEHHIADRSMSILEGSILAIRQRVLVHEDFEEQARELLTEADLGQWLSR